jgi:hypothetical protein
MSEESILNNPLQLKRVTDNYNNHKGRILASGEPLALNVSINGKTAPIFLVGDGVTTIEDLISSGKVFINFMDIESYIDAHTGKTDNTIKPIKVKDTENASTPTPVAGTSNEFARADHEHVLDKYIPIAGIAGETKPINEKKGPNDSTSNSEGESPNFARADHVHKLDRFIPYPDSTSESLITTIEENATKSSGTSYDYARADHTHKLDVTVPKAETTAATITSVLTKDKEGGDTPDKSAGTSNKFAKADHQHILDKFIPSGDSQTDSKITTIKVNNKKSAGASSLYARADHTHDIGFEIPSPQNESTSTTPSSSTTMRVVAESNNTASLVGTSKQFARADHVHKIRLATLEAVLGENRCRTITYGTSNPSDSKGEDGDIYIKLDS